MTKSEYQMEGMFENVDLNKCNEDELKKMLVTLSNVLTLAAEKHVELEMAMVDHKIARQTTLKKHNESFYWALVAGFFFGVAATSFFGALL